jgi:hypothetical protein
VGPENGPLSLMSTIGELLRRKISGSGLENREYDRGDPSLWRRGTLYPQQSALTSPTSGDRSVRIVRSRTQATQFSFSLVLHRLKACYPVSCVICIFRYSGASHPGISPPVNYELRTEVREVWFICRSALNLRCATSKGVTSVVTENISPRYNYVITGRQRRRVQLGLVRGLSLALLKGEG